MVEGTLELIQLVRYQVPSDRTNSKTENDEKGDKSEFSSHRFNTKQNVIIEHENHAILKSRSDTIVIPCTTEFKFLGQFFSLNKEILEKAVHYEDFLLQVEFEIRSTDIEILDLFLITVSLQNK